MNAKAFNAITMGVNLPPCAPSCRFSLASAGAPFGVAGAPWGHAGPLRRGSGRTPIQGRPLRLIEVGAPPAPPAPLQLGRSRRFVTRVGGASRLVARLFADALDQPRLDRP